MNTRNIVVGSFVTYGISVLAYAGISLALGSMTFLPATLVGIGGALLLLLAHSASRC